MEYGLTAKRKIGTKFKHRYLITISNKGKIKLVTEVTSEDLRKFPFKLREFVIASDKEFNEIDFEFFYQLYNGQARKQDDYIVFDVQKFSLEEMIQQKFEKNYRYRTFIDISNCIIDEIRYLDSEGKLVREKKENEEMEKLNTTTEATATIYAETDSVKENEEMENTTATATATATATNNFVNEALKKKISLKEIAKASVSPSDLMIGRDKIDSDTLAKEYDFITLEAVDIFTKDDKEMSVITFKEDNTKFHFGATVLTQFIKKWVDACETIENVNELLKLEEVKIKISKKLSKQNNVYYSVEILD